MLIARWGLIPVWSKDPRIGSRMINARAETLTEKPSFKGLLKKHRCIVVADGFFEWKHEGVRKIPMYITLKGRQPFGFAGLFSLWKDPDGETVPTCTIITVAANVALQVVHDRMPAILSKKDEARWIDAEQDYSIILPEVLRPYPPKEIVCYEVRPPVNSTSNDIPENIKRIA